jgi:hypothetical protein
VTGPQRPAFHEGQVLAAADLTAAVEHARGQTARHSRLLHDWGIADGLGLVTENVTDPVSRARYVRVTVSPGMVVDGTGREIVVAEPVVLRETAFQEVNGSPEGDEPYPLFLTARDAVPSGRPAGAPGCDTPAGPTRTAESYQITFGRPGDERLVAEQQPPPASAAPAAPPAQWLVLLGYVRWSEGHFAGVVTTVRGIGPRYAGIRADTVSARSGVLTLRSGTGAEEGQPAVVVSGGDSVGLVFGRYRGDGSVDPLMTVEGNGNLTVQGGFVGRRSTGSVLVGSGTATDGMLLPLPAGVAPEEVADGRTVLHVQVRPRVPPSGPPDGSPTAMHSPVEATVDADRRLRCRVRWFDPMAAAPRVVELPGAVDFVVLATVPATEGSGG